VNYSVSSVATVDRNGVGVMAETYHDAGIEVYLSSPYLIDRGESLVAVANGASIFKLSSSAGQDGWFLVSLSNGLEKSGETVSYTDLALTASGLTARVTSFPFVTPYRDGRTQWQTRGAWNGLADDGTFVPLDEAAVPADVFSVVSDGTTDLAVQLMDDPGDDSLGGAIAGMGLRSRTVGQPWTEPTLVLSGPGGDYIDDVVSNNGRWIMAGRSVASNADGVYTRTPVLQEGDGVTFGDVTIEGLTDQATLTNLIAASMGPVVATGTRYMGQDSFPLVVGRRADGTWAVGELGATSEPTLLGGASTGSQAVLLGREGDARLLYRSTDGTTFTRTELLLPNATTAYPSEVVAVGSRLVLAGTVAVAGVSRPAVWTADDGVHWVEVPLSGADSSTELKIDDALAVDSDTLAIGGVVRRQAVVWTLDLPARR
jgi:hypothetical protein